MSDKKIFNFTVGELMAILQEFPQNMPVIVSGYENGYENFNKPVVKKIEHLAKNKYWDGEFQIDENSDDNSIDALILKRVLRDD